MAGIGTSGVTVPTTIMSSVGASIPAASSAILAAWVAMSLVTVPSGAIRRSLMPVRSVIHASEVSTIRSMSAFVRTTGGR